MEEKKKSKKGIIIAIIIAAVIIAIAIIGFFGYHGQQVALLTVETQKAIATKTTYEDGSINKEAKIDMEIKTKGGYAIVEETLKNYLNEVLTTAQEAENLYQEEEIENILSAENIKTDGPEFVKTKAKIAEMKKAGEEYIEKLINLCSEEKLLAAIDEKEVDDYYKELYKQLATDEEAGKEVEETVRELEKSKTTLTSAFDYLNSIVEFLSNNKSSWEIEDNQIVFYSQQKLDEYNALLSAMPAE